MPRPDSNFDLTYTEPCFVAKAMAEMEAIRKAADEKSRRELEELQKKQAAEQEALRKRVAEESKLAEANASKADEAEAKSKLSAEEAALLAKQLEETEVQHQFRPFRVSLVLSLLPGQEERAREGG